MTTMNERGIDWSEQAAAHLLDARTCPICVAAQLVDGRCPQCGVDLTGRAGADLWAASVEAARVLRYRANLQRGALATRTPAHLPAQVPVPDASAAGSAHPTDAVAGESARMPVAALSAVAAPVAAAPPAAPAGAPPAPAAPLPDAQAPSQAGAQPGMQPAAPPAPLPSANRAASPGASLQSVLATAGAGLFAVAAIVFTFFNPDLADRAVRSVIIGLVTLVFLGGAWLLARRRLQSSAEAVGGLGLVFVGLDVQAVAGTWVDDTTSWTAAAIATGVAGGLLLAAALRARIRIWLWAALPALAAVPAMLGFAAQDALLGALLLAGSAFAGTGLCALLPRFALLFPLKETPAAAPVPPLPPVALNSGAAPTAPPRPRRPLAAEAAVLTAAQLIATVLAVGRIVLAGRGEFLIALVLAVLAVQAVLAARYVIPRLWAFLSGVLGAVAGAFAAVGLRPDGALDWTITVIVAGAAVVLIGTAVVPLPARTPRPLLAAGAAVTVALTSAPSVIGGLIIGSSLLRSTADIAQRYPLSETTTAAVVALGVVAVCLVVFALLAASRPDIARLTVPAHAVAVLYGTGAVLALGCSGLIVLPASIGVVLAAAAAVGLLLVRTRGRGAEVVRWMLTVAVHVALLVAVLLSWQDRALVPYAGAATLVVLAVAARTLPAEVRFLHVGAGYAYALALVATALSLGGVMGIAQFSLTASAGLLGAIVATFLSRIGARNWYAVLVVATVPFAIGIVQVLVERSGWTALSTGLMFVLALVLLTTRRPGLTAPVRIAAAGLLVPTLAVVVVCLCAQLLAQSGSPVALPIIAVLVAFALASGVLVSDLLVARGRDERTAEAARVAIEASALLTGAIAVVLALAREAAGLGTACLVLIVLGVGAALASGVAGRRYGWWVAAASFTGALWSAWALAGVELPEAYLLPPALGAAVVGIVLTMRGRPAVGLFAVGLGVATVPLDVLLAAAPGTDAVPWRAFGLLAAGWALLGLIALIARASASRLHRLRVLRAPALGAAAVAAIAGTIQAARWESGTDAAPLAPSPIGVLLVGAGLSALASLALVVVVRMLRGQASAVAHLRESTPAADGASAGGRAKRTSPREAHGSLGQFTASRWLYAPAVLAFTIGVWPAIERDWAVIWTMWSLMLAVLILMLCAATARGAMLPPVWFLFGIAFVTAVVAWSPRDLRVEWFSLPLGAFLLAAGALGLRGDGMTEHARVVDWPRGWRGSWPLLAPGLIVMMSASVVSTFTDPLTWRAILVMVLALVAILAGASRRLSAPFIIGLIVLPIENVFVFSVQLGRGIESMPWWITLATIGAVLLIIAVAGERREGADRGVVARMRDLR